MCVIDTFSKYAWVVPLKNKKGVSNINTFHKNLKEPKKCQIKYGLTKEVNFAIILSKIA